MPEIIKTTFQLKRAKSDRWAALNPILAKGEPGFELDTGLLKIGNGVTHWRNLGYIGDFSSGDESDIGLISRVTNLEQDVNVIETRLSSLEEGDVGTPGNGIASIKQTTTSTQSGGTNIITVTLTDGTYATFEIKNGTKGEAGTQGAKGEKGDSFNWRGEYSSSAQYHSNDVIYYEGSSYICVKDSFGYLPTNATYWSLMAKKGEEGTGDSGTVSIEKVLDEQVYFSKDYYTVYDIGKIKGSKGRTKLIEKDQKLSDFMAIFDEEKEPTVTQPSVSIRLRNAGSYEAGTIVTTHYIATFSSGNYPYNEKPTETGVTVTAWTAKDSLGQTKTNPSSSFSDLTVTENTNYSVTITATHTNGIIPVTNQGNPCPSKQIAQGTKSATSAKITGYRSAFWGTCVDKKDLDTIDMSALVRALATQTSYGLSRGATFDVSIPTGITRVMIAYPQSLPDLTSIVDVNGMSTNVIDSFKRLENQKIKGYNDYEAIDYKVYYIDYADPTIVTNTYKAVMGK